MTLDTLSVEQIYAMEAGRELDKLIATYIFGARYNGYLEKEEFEIWKFGENDNRWLPCYSTEISPAWEVVEKLRAAGLQTTIDTNKIGYQVDIRRIQSGSYIGPPTVKTCPLAICRAALKAVISQSPKKGLAHVN